MLVDTGANVTLLRTHLAKNLTEIFIKLASSILLKIVIGNRVNTHGELHAVINFGSRIFEHKIYITDITEQCIIRLDFLKKFNLTVDLASNEARTIGEKIPLLTSNTR